MPRKDRVISLFDATTLALDPWLARGYSCWAYDLLHCGHQVRGRLHCVEADLDCEQTMLELVAQHRGRVAFVMALPPCTDLASAGAPSWARKRAEDPVFQARAAARAVRCADLARAVGCDAWMVENPVGLLGKLWRTCDFTFSPCEYGGYLPKNDTHPLYPKHIPARDAYNKKTCIWHGPGISGKPPVRPVTVKSLLYRRKSSGELIRYSP